ncbi:hypothetical protein ACFFNA_40580, partial [Mesorhizobium kowhaii]
MKHSKRLRMPDQATFMQKASVDFERKFVPRLEEDIDARQSWGYATTCNAVSRYAGGQAGIEACRAVAARLSQLDLALMKKIEPRALSLFASSFGRDPLSTKCRDGAMRIARICQDQRGVLGELGSQNLSLLANGFSKWPEAPDCRKATAAIADEVLRR